MLTMIRKNDEGTLSVLESDMVQMPIAWIDSVNNTLVHLRRQKDVCESLDPVQDLTFPSLLQSAIICKNLGKTKTFIMDRQPPKDNDSGWFCGCAGEHHDHQEVKELARVSLFEAAVKHESGIIPYLALPPGALLSVGPEGPSVSINENRLSFRPGSYLAARHAKA
jgi:hypothetical protein